MKDPTFGRIDVRLDVLAVLAGAGLISSGMTTAALFVTIAFHELGHALAAFVFTRRFSLTLQLTGGSVYVRRIERRWAQAVVLLAGPLAGLIPVGVGTLWLLRSPGGGWGEVGEALRYCAGLWSCFQLLPFPPMDGGILVRRVLFVSPGRATAVWKASWIAGFAMVAGTVVLEPRLLEPAVWLTGMAVILGRAEAGYVRHIDAFAAWERGEFQEVVRRVRAMPGYVVRADRVALLELGVAAARELEDAPSVEGFAAQLPAAHATAVSAAEWLLLHGRAFGARLAEQAFDALDADRVSGVDIDRERWGDLAFRLAIFEAEQLKMESALGMLERAVDLGFDDVDRLEAEASFARIADHPRFLIARARAVSDHAHGGRGGGLVTTGEREVR